MKNIRLGTLVACMCVLWAVSYTHLDVYKRQVYELTLVSTPHRLASLPRL